jgi:hypothetical protein
MYAYTKTIVCLANSRKISGRCIAGKEYADGVFGDWVRPVSARPDEEISEDDRRYQSGDYANLLHIATIPMTQPIPDGFQIENHRIDDGYYWTREGNVSWHQLHTAVDEVDTLWIDGHSSYNGINDRVPADRTATVYGSLLFLGPLALNLEVSAEGAAFGNFKRRVRAYFKYRGRRYACAVTDPFIERAYLAGADGRYAVDQAFVCVSLAKVWDGFAYKLVAAIITPERAP